MKLGIGHGMTPRGYGIKWREWEKKGDAVHLQTKGSPGGGTKILFIIYH